MGMKSIQVRMWAKSRNLVTTIAHALQIQRRLGEITPMGLQGWSKGQFV